MKHLKLLNILIVMLLLTAWAPVPSNTPGMPTAALAAPVLSGPASGTIVTGYQPTFSWRQPAYATVSFNVAFSFDPYFKNAAKLIALVNYTAAPVDGVVSYTPAFFLPSNSSMYWRVQAVTAETTSAWSAYRNVKTWPFPISGIVGPTGGVNVHTLRPTLLWDATLDAPTPNMAEPKLRTNKFNVQVINATTKALVKAVTVTATSEEASYAFTADLLRNTAYQWRVRADGLFKDSDWSAYQDFVTANPPTVPVLVSPASGFVLDPAVNGGIPTLTWKASTTTKNPAPAITYTLQYSPSAKFDRDVTTVPGLTEPTYTLPGTPDAGTYSWRVMAVDAEGDMSNWSLVRVFKTWPSLNITVRDFLTKEGINEASLLVTGLPAAVTTNASGEYFIPSLKPGTKYVTVTKADYVTKKVSVSVVAGVPKQLVIEMVHVPVYVKLYWTDPYQNLDLHLWIPEEYTFGADQEGGHIMADHKGITTAKPYAKLSADILKGSATAVETITIQNRYPGKYVIGVYSYNKSNFFGSNAKVKIYMGTVLMQEIVAPATPDNNFIWWHVADLSTGGALDPVNQLVSDSPGPYDPDGGTFAIPQ